MQFLWRYVDDLVGKGVEIKVLAELFFYAANHSLPLALPISILLASLIAFGNLGEHMELLAMKSSGISLFTIMKPLIILMIFLSGVAFIYQNNVTPHVQSKFATIIYSIKMKSPELDIPAKSFFNGITDYSLYIQHKEKNGLLRDVMIYDYSGTFENLSVTKADSARLKMSDDKKYLIMTLYNGSMFSNFNTSNSGNNASPTAFQRQTFITRDILIEFDSNFNMVDETITRDREYTKNIPELRSFIQTAGTEVDSISKELRPGFTRQIYSTAFKQDRSYQNTNSEQPDSSFVADFALFFKNLPDNQKIQILDDAKSKAERLSSEYSFQMFSQSGIQKRVRMHEIELHRKFTYSLACLFFFFIGAPLGAIIRKGGIGMPAVLSVFIFTMYYTIDDFGRRMAKEGMWQVWEGMWLSSLMLVSLGAFFTYKAVNDSTVMSTDVWKENLLRLFGKREIRNYRQKEIIMNQPDYPEDISLMEKWNEKTNIYLKQKLKRPNYFSFWKQNFQNMDLSQLLSDMDNWIDDLLNSDENLIIGKLMDYPVIAPFNLSILNKPAVRWSCFVILPMGILIYILYILKQKQIISDLKTSIKVNEEISKELRNMNLD